MNTPPIKKAFVADKQENEGATSPNTPMTTGIGKKSPQALEHLRRTAEKVHQKKNLSIVEKHRQMSIIYSRRKRIKQKMRLEGLEEQRHELSLANERVRQENDRLELILKQAKTTAALVEREKAMLRAHMLKEKEDALSLASAQLFAAATSMPHGVTSVGAIGLGGPRGFDIPSITSLLSESSRSRLLTRSLCTIGSEHTRPLDRTTIADLASNIILLRAQELMNPREREGRQVWDVLHRNGC